MRLPLALIAAGMVLIALSAAPSADGVCASRPNPLNGPVRVLPGATW